MSDWRGRALVIILFLATVSVVFVLLFVRDNNEESDVPALSAVSGRLVVGVEPSLSVLAKRIAPVFGSYYPKADIEVQTGFFEAVFNRFLGNENGAMLFSGMPGDAERNVLDGIDKGYRLEPVAKSAVVCVVNSRVSRKSISLPELADIFTARKHQWREGEEIAAFLNKNDISLHRQFQAAACPEKDGLAAQLVDSDDELLEVVSVQKGAIVLLSLSGYAEVMKSGRYGSSTRILPVSPTGNDEPVMPSQYNVFTEKYPLAYIIYYLYRKDNPLAAGFGAWLGDQARELFVRSSIAPFREPERVIMLKSE